MSKTIEEKAKAYDKALERAKEYWETDDDNTLDIKARGTMEYLFPELAESEDEKIRKEILEVAKTVVLCDGTLYGKKYNCREWIAWLEKQCPKENNANEETNAPTGYGKYVDECLNEASKHFFSEEEDKYSVADLFYAGVRCGQSWLEKQGDNVSGECNDTALGEQLKIWFEKGKCSGIDDVIFHPQKYGLEKQGEQNPTECIKFSNEFENQISHLLLSVLNREYEYNEGFVKYAAQSLLGYAKNELKPIEWSEEDEKILDLIIQDYEAASRSFCGHRGKLDWLNDLKERYTWKPSSELDEASYQVGIKRVLENPESYGLTKYNWKPSDVQMQLLKEACDEHWEPDRLDPLYTLYEDLKKLKGE